MTERETEERITEGSFKADLLTRRQKILNLALNGVLSPEEAEAGIVAIENVLANVNEALLEDLRVKYYKRGDELSYSIEDKGQAGFIWKEKHT